MGGAMFPPYYLTWGQTMVEVKVPCRHCCIQCPLPCSRPQPTHASARDSWTLMGKSGSVSCRMTGPFSWVLVCTGFYLCPPIICFSVLCKFSWLCGGLMVTSKRAYAIPRSTAPRAPAPAAAHCWLYLIRRDSNIVLTQSLWGLWVLVCTRFVWPSEHLCWYGVWF